ncbi:MAG: diguanylate cyclase, partial [Candidatus Sericytochromatia bacterium]
LADHVEVFLKSLVAAQNPEPLSLPSGAWQSVAKLLKSIQTYLSISRQSLEDRAELYDEMEHKLEENEQKLLDNEDRLRQNEQKLQRSEYKVLEYTLALQHINLIQRKIQGTLSIGSLLTEATQLLVFHLCAHRGVFLRMDYQNHSVQIMSPINCPYDETASLPSEALQQMLQDQSMDHPPPVETQEANIRILRLDGESSPLYGISFQSALLVPVWVDRDLWGVFCLFDKEERLSPLSGGQAFTAFGESDEMILRNVVAFLQKDLRNAYLFEMATVDGLSQLYVRRYFENRLRDEIRRARRHPAIFSLLMLDIDHFKRVNDTYGHLVGDVVIRKVADVLRNSLRQGIDLPARFGGEEMVVLLPNTPLSGATLVAERIRKAIAEMFVEELASTRALPHITISAGVASFPDQGDEFKSLLEAADQALYRAKAAGRNKVCDASEILT